MMKKQEGPRGFQMDDPAVSEAGSTASARSAHGEPSPVGFGAFVMSLSTSAMIHLGALPAPGEEKPCANLPLAQQSIAMLEMLQEKTRGKLDEQEQRLLEGILHDLHMRYVSQHSSGK